MTRIQIRCYEMLGRSVDFGTAYAHLFPESSLARQMFLALADVVQQLSAHTVSKLSALRGTTNKAMARATLFDRLRAISRTARVIAENTPGLEEKFVVPPFPSDQVLLMTARVFAQDAGPLEARFIALAMPTTFLADFEGEIASLEQAIHQRVAGKGERIAAREHIAALLASGFSAVRALDVMVANHLRDDPATLAVWKSDRRVQYPNRPKSTAAQPAAAAAPAPAEAAHAAGEVMS